MSVVDHDLVRLQRQFMAHLQGSTSDALHAAVDGGHLPPATGLGIYAHAYGTRLREALDNDHPVLGAYLGDELWDTLCRGYIQAHPSRVRSLRDFGNALPAFLAETEQFRGHPQLAELARFERLLLDSFDAADDPRADWTQLQAIAPERWPSMRVRLHRSVRVHRARHGSVAIWQAIKADQAPPDYAGIEDAVDWVLWRDADGVGRFRSLEHDSAAAFGCCRHSGSFAELCELMAITHPIGEVPARVLGYLQDWCGQGWIARWETEGNGAVFTPG